MLTIKFVKDCEYKKGEIVTLKNNEAHPFVFEKKARPYKPRKPYKRKKKAMRNYPNRMITKYKNK